LVRKDIKTYICDFCCCSCYEL